MRRRWVVLPVVVILVLLAGYGAVSWVFSDKLVAQQFTALGPVDFSEYALPAPETVTIRGEDVGLVAWYFENPRDAGCATVMLHGFGGSKAEVLAPPRSSGRAAATSCSTTPAVTARATARS